MSTEFPQIPPETAGLLVIEMLHRHANELAATLATLRIMKSRGKIADSLLDEALARVEAQGSLQRLLLDRPANGTLRDALQDLCQLLLRSRMGAEKFKIVLQSNDLPVPMPLRIPILLCAYELINNAIRHHHPANDEPIKVVFARAESTLSLKVSNKTFSHIQPRANSTGLDIVKSISTACGGDTIIIGKKGRFHAKASFFARPAPHRFRYIDGDSGSSDDDLPF